jgi:hypothetical protein
MCPFNDLGKPQFFYKVVQSWVAFKLVQVLQKFGQNPKFKTILDKWSKDMHCVVQFLKRIPQQDDENKQARLCVDILFHPKKTEHFGSFIRQGEKDIIELGMLSIMQMHSNETGTAEAKYWKHTFNDISALYHNELNSNKLIDSVMIDTPQKKDNAPAPTAETGEDDVFDDSDDDDETSSHTRNHTKRFSLFDDEEDNDDLDTQNPLHKGSGHEKNTGIVELLTKTIFPICSTLSTTVK